MSQSLSGLQLLTNTDRTRSVSIMSHCSGHCKKGRITPWQHPVRLQHGAMDPYIASKPKLRILCLHGRCQTASTFERKLERIVSKSASFADFVPPGCNSCANCSTESICPCVCSRNCWVRFVDAPRELPLQHGERVNTTLICKTWGVDNCGSALLYQMLSTS